MSKFDKEKQENYEREKKYLVSENLEEADKQESLAKFHDIIDECGPVVSTYPAWHPLVANHKTSYPETEPSERCGYQGLDHDVYFRNGFITCPYGDSGNVEKIVNSVKKLPTHPIATISAEILDVKFYMPNASPVLIRCEWDEFLNRDGTIPKKFVIPLLLERELPTCRDAEVAETWESMQHYFLGSPHTSNSSLFVDEDTGKTIKKLWNLLIHTGMYGNIRVT